MGRSWIRLNNINMMSLFLQRSSIISTFASKQLFRCAMYSTGATQPKIAVILSGAGVYDGTEVHEASACLVHLSRAGAECTMFAPNIAQMHALDHTTGKELPETRNVLVESARIARGKVQALSELTGDVGSFEGLVVPGGFGAAKNLSSFAVDGVDCKVNEDVEKVLTAFHAQKKPIGLCCIAPVLAAKVIPGCSVTVGSDEEEGGRWPYAGTAAAITKLGATHVKKEPEEAHIDTANNIVTAPAYMCETGVHHIFDGIGKMIDGVLSLA